MRAYSVVSPSCALIARQGDLVADVEGRGVLRARGEPGLEARSAEHGDIARAGKALRLDRRELSGIACFERVTIRGEAAAATDPPRPFQQRRICRCANARLMYRGPTCVRKGGYGGKPWVSLRSFTVRIYHAVIGRVISLVHARIDTAHDARGAAAVRHREQRPHADDRHFSPEREALHDTARDAQAGERARAFTESDRVEVAQANAARAQK